jgi:folylpolyglutamate synthase/dihydropteroate synthase
LRLEQVESDKMLIEAFDAQMPCRMEKVNTPALVAAGIDLWLDVCHNEQGLSKVLSQFATDPDKASKPLAVICGYSKGKNIAKMLEMLANHPSVSQVYPVSCSHFRLLNLAEL